MDKPQTKQTQPDPNPGVDLNQSIRNRAARGSRLLSPWVQHWLRPDSPAAAARQPAFLRAQQPVMLTQAGTGFFLHRIQRMPERSLAWKPDVGSLKPGMTDPLTRKVAGRAHFRPVGVKLKSETAPEQAALNYGEEPEFTLPGGGGMVAAAGADFEQEVQQKGSLLDAIRDQDGEVSARVPEILKNLPRSGGQLIPPAPRQRKKTVRERPNISPKSRLFTAVQEVDAGRSGPEPEQPPAAPAIEPDDDTAAQAGLGPDPPGPPQETNQAELLFLQPAQKPESSREKKSLPPDAAVPLVELPEPPVPLPPAKKPNTPVIKPDRPTVPEPENARPVINPDPSAQTLGPMPEIKSFSPRLILKKQATVTENVEQIEAREPLPVSLPEQPASPATTAPLPVQAESPSLPLGAAVQLEAKKKSLPVVKPDTLPAGMVPPAPADMDAALPGQPDEVPGQPHLLKTPSSEPPHPLLHLDQTITKRIEMPPSLPLIKPRRPSRPVRRRIQPSPSQQPPAITPQAARLQLVSRGWRFKTGPVDRPGEAKRIIQTAAGLEKPGGTGAPLADEPRAAMEGTLGRDFSDVRVHRADLGPLNVQAATRGRDVFFDKGQDDFDRPQGMALLGHELTHVGQAGTVQAKPKSEANPPAGMPLMRMPAEVKADEAEADQVEQTVYRQAQTGSLPLARPVIQRAAIPDLEPDSGPYLNDIGGTESYAQVQNRQPTYPEDLFDLENDEFEEQQTDNEDVFTGLQDTLEEMIDERMAQMMDALGLAETEETTAPPGPDTLARQILPFLKRLIVVERERRAF